MTNLQIMMLLHYYCNAEPYAKGNPAHANSHAVSEQRKWLIEHDMLAVDDNAGDAGFTVTERGAAFIEHINRLPLPEKTWAMKADR